MNSQYIQASYWTPDYDPSFKTNDTVLILSDSDFISQDWSGNGTKENPFIIENLRIESEDYCIRIENTRSYFVIRDCYIWQRKDYYLGIHFTQGAPFGILLNNVTLGNITDCIFEFSIYKAISMNATINCNVTSNIIKTQNDSSHYDTYSSPPIEIQYSDSCIINNNSIIGFEVTIYENSNSNCTIQDNLIYEKDYEPDEFGPTIQHTVRMDVTITMVGPIGGFTFRVNVQDQSNVSCVTLFYGLTEDGEFSSIVLQSEDNNYEKSVELDLDNPYHLYLYYYYWANDTLGNWRKTPIDLWFLNSGEWTPFTTTTSSTSSNTTETTTNSNVIRSPFIIGIASVIFVGCVVLVIIWRKR